MSSSMLSEAAEVRDILARVEERLGDGDDVKVIRKNFNELICLLDSPLFCQLLSVKDAIDALLLGDNDLDIDPATGKLVLKQTDIVDHKSDDEITYYNEARPSVSAVHHRQTENKNTNVLLANQHIAEVHADFPDEGFPLDMLQKLAPGCTIESVTLDKPDGVGIGLGFGIVGLRSDSAELGVYVQNIQRGSVADKDGRLCENDQLLAIDGHLVGETSSLEDAVHFLQHAAGSVTLVVAHKEDSPHPLLHTSLSPTSSQLPIGENAFSSALVQVEVIDLINDGSGLGFGIIGAKGIGVIIKTIIAGGVSARDGRLRSGDCLLQIGDVDVRDLTTEEVANVLRQSGIHVRLIVARNVDTMPDVTDPDAPVIPANHLEEHLMSVNQAMDFSRLSSDADLAEFHASLQSLPPLSSPPVGVFEVKLNKDHHGLGITIAGYTDQTDGKPRIFVSGITEGSVANLDGRIRLGDQIIAVDNQSLEGFDNQQALDVLRSTGQTVCLALIRRHHDMPPLQSSTSSVSSRSLYANVPPVREPVFMNDADQDLLSRINTVPAVVQPKDDIVKFWQSVVGPRFDIVVADVVKSKSESGLGVNLASAAGDEDPSVEVPSRHFITDILPDGAVSKTGLIHVDDELLAVNDCHICGLPRAEVATALRDLPQRVRIVCARRKFSADDMMSLGSSTSTMQRLVKAKSEQSLASTSESASLSRNKSKSLEPLSKFGIWSSEPTEVLLIKADRGLGFSILDDPDTMNPGKQMIIIRSLVSGGMAERDGRLEPGDRLISVNGINLFNATLEEAVQALKGTARGVVTLRVLKPQRFSESSTDYDVRSGSVEPMPVSQLSSQKFLWHTDRLLLNSSLHDPQVTPDERMLVTNTLTVPGDHGAVPYVEESDHKKKLDQSPSALRPEPASVPELRRHSAAAVHDFDDSFRPSPLSPLNISPLLLPVSSAKSSPPRSGDKRVTSSWKTPHTVEVVRRPGESLGISIVGGGQVDGQTSSDPARNVTGIYIKHVKPDSPAGSSGLLKNGDRILEVNGCDLRNATHDQAVDVIRHTTGPVRFLVQSLTAPSSLAAAVKSSTPVHNTLDNNRNAKVKRENSSSEGSEDGNADPYWEEIVKRYGELDGELHMVKLRVDPSANLGLDLAGNSHLDKMSVFVAGIHPDSPVARDGRIHVGDELLEINERVLYGRSHLNAPSVIMSIRSPDITIVLLRREDFQKEMAVTSTQPSVPVKNDRSTLILSQSVMDDESTSANQSSHTAHSSEVTATSSDRALSPLDVESFDNVAFFCLEKGERGFGFAIEEAKIGGDRTGIFVKTITANGPAALQKTLSVGDRLLLIEDTSLVGVTYDQALSILRSVDIGATVQLTVSKSLPSAGNQVSDSDSLATFVSNSASVPEASAYQRLEMSDSHTSSPPRQRHVSPGRANASSAHQSPARHAVLPVVTVSATPVFSSSSPSRQRSSLTPAAATVIQDPTSCPIIPGRETTIEINKGKSGLGLSIVGGSDTLLGAVIVHEVYDNGAAAKDGRLLPGDQMLEVCGDSLEGMTHENAIRTLRQTPAIITLVVLRDDPSVDDDIYDTVTADFVKKPGHGLGFSIVTHQNGIFISDIMKGSVVDTDGRLKPADQIIGLNGKELLTATREQIAELLKTSSGVVSITVRRLKSPALSRPGRRPSDQNNRNDDIAAVGNPPKSASKISANVAGPDASINDAAATQLTVSLSRQDRGLLKMSLVPQALSSGRPGPLVIDDMYGTGIAIADKLQINDRILSINGHETNGMSDVDAFQFIHTTTDSVTFVIERDIPVQRPAARAHDNIQQQSVVHDAGEFQTGPVGESLREVVLHRGVHGFGFAIVGGFGSDRGDFPVVIKNVFPSGPAAADGRLKRGDQLLAVNGIGLDEATHDQVVNLLKNAGNVVRLLISS